MPLGIVTALLLVAGLISAVVVRPADSNISIDALARAASEVADARSATMTMSLGMSGLPSAALVAQPRAGTPISFRIETDRASDSGRLTMALPTGGSMNAVMTREFVYLAVPAERRGTSGGKAWLKAPVPQTHSATAFGQMPDGEEYLRLLAGAKGSVTPAGEERIEGETLRKYAVEVDVEATASHARDPEKSLAQFQQLGIKTIPTTVWLTEEGALRQMRMVIGVGDIKAEVNMRIVTSPEPIVIEIPNDADCQPVPDMNAAMLGLIS